MKKTLIIILALISNHATSHTQTNTTSLNHNQPFFAFKIDLVGPAMSISSGLNSFGLALEYFVSNNFSLQINGNYAFSRANERVQDDLQIIPEAKFILTDKSKNRYLYTGAYFKYNNYRDKHYGSIISPNQYDLRLDYRNQGIGLGPTLGYQVIFNHLSIEARVGIGVYKNLETDIYYNEIQYHEPKSPSIDAVFAIFLGWVIMKG
jgi:hypothetical protein